MKEWKKEGRKGRRKTGKKEWKDEGRKGNKYLIANSHEYEDKVKER